MTAQDTSRRTAYDSGDPVAIYDATRETRNRLIGALAARLPREEALSRIFALDDDFEAVDAFDVDALKAARQRYRDQLAQLPDAR